MIHFVTVATHEEGYLNILKSQLNEKKQELIQLGKNKKYEGHFMKDKLMLEYLQNVNDTDIVVFCDGFDSIFIGDVDELKQKFLNFDADIVLSIENIGALSFIHNAVFSKYEGHFINTGLYMGYAKALKELLTDMYSFNYDPYSNQKTWVGYLLLYRNKVTLDKKSTLFLNDSFTTNNNYKVKDRRVVLNTNEKPIFIQGNGKTDMNFILKNTLYYNKDIKPGFFTKLKYNYNALFKLYNPIVRLYVILLIIIFIILTTIIYLYYKDYIKTSS